MAGKELKKPRNETATPGSHSLVALAERLGIGRGHRKGGKEGSPLGVIAVSCSGCRVGVADALGTMFRGVSCCST